MSSSSQPKPSITLHFLQASRCIRTAWHLHLLQLPYNLNFSPREKGLAPAAFKAQAGGLGKFPTLQDNNQTFYESGNICEYLSDVYDTSHKFLPAPGDPQRYKILQWVHASEGTYALHGIAVLYIKWFQKSGDVEETLKGAGGNIGRDLDFLEKTLEGNGEAGEWIMGDKLSVADIMMHFSAAFVLERGLHPGPKGEGWPRVRKWIEKCEGTESYKEAVERTGHSFDMGV